MDPSELERRRARRRERVVKRLLLEVEQLLEREGSYHDLTVEQIVDASGIARSTFYSYFTDKADLIVALAESAMTGIIDASGAIWALPSHATREQVADAVGHTIATYLPHTRLMNAVIEVSSYDPRARERFLAGYARASRAAAQHIREGQSAGFIRCDLDPDETAGWFTWMAERGMSQLVQYADEAGVRRLQRSYASILWYTLYDGQAGGVPATAASGRRRVKPPRIGRDEPRGGHPAHSRPEPGSPSNE